ncbi:phosphoribosylformimino-5-aminoimidazole carboxamide ribotide isomerase [Clostridium sp. 19966]|nr:phosphoribosylformimino-5-aminoimidazole carboxamide ribotide isomerase [Clostridium sp. 19966]MDT8717639.1 phosphoribosylformimino-5-aminoimidazole carboxamide ribotide isomerase [Clostridium sp. 19966]
MKFRPCIDIHSGKVKQIVGGSLRDDGKGIIENFVSDKDSSYYAEMFKRDKLIGGHVIMLGKGNDEEALKALRAYRGGLQIGGGIKDENCEIYLENGASHVIVTSYVFKDGEINFHNLNKLVAKIGKERLVLDLSCREKQGEYFVVTDRWQKFTKVKIEKNTIKELESYCDEFLIHAVDVEGKSSGIQKNLVKILGELISIPATYAGGISSFEDMEEIRTLGKGNIDFTVGSSLDIFGGRLSYDRVKHI